MTTPSFKGFKAASASTFKLYQSFVTDLMPQIQNPDELKVTLFALWAIQQREGTNRYLVYSDFTANAELIKHLNASLDDALILAIVRGSLYAEIVHIDGHEEELFFINDDDGRAAVEQVRAGEWIAVAGSLPVEILPPRPTIYALYEQNIGALTPMIRDELIAAQKEFPEGWIDEAMRIAVSSNKRNWRYVRAVLDRWQKEGKQNETPTRPHAEPERRIARDPSDFIIR